MVHLIYEYAKDILAVVGVLFIGLAMIDHEAQAEGL